MAGMRLGLIQRTEEASSIHEGSLMARGLTKSVHLTTTQPSAPMKPAHSPPDTSSSPTLSAPAAPADSTCFFLPLLALLTS